MNYFADPLAPGPSQRRLTAPVADPPPGPFPDIPGAATFELCNAARPSPQHPIIALR